MQSDIGPLGLINELVNSARDASHIFSKIISCKSSSHNQVVFIFFTNLTRYSIV